VPAQLYLSGSFFIIAIKTSLWNLFQLLHLHFEVRAPILKSELLLCCVAFACISQSVCRELVLHMWTSSEWQTFHIKVHVLWNIENCQNVI
jgi:hypothetical protein